MRDQTDYVEQKDMQQFLIETLTALIKFPTFVPPGEHYGEIVDWLISMLTGFGFVCERIDIPQEIVNVRLKDADLHGVRANLIATKAYAARESVDLYTHLDVVPAGEGWSTPPFEPVIKDGKIFGRGVADPKGNVAALLTALHIMEVQELESRYSLRVVLTTDEELGLYSGLCYFADEGLLQGDYMLCMDTDNEGICVATNGVLNWEMVIHGRSSHSSTPFLGVNAVEQAALVVHELQALKGEIERRESAVPCSPEITDLTGQQHIKPVFNVTMINGGVKENLIPPSCRIRGDRRYIPEESADSVVEEFKDAVATIKADHGIDLNLTPKPGFPPMFTDPSHDWVRRVQAAASAAFGVPKGINGVQGGLDVGYAVQRSQQPVCSFGVWRCTESNIHGPDENVRISDLTNYVKFLLRLLTRQKET
ncbi:MAG: ArgE/DapE family deacylase [Methanomicrobia archaeon]|nr:ArgE/DapE family deacylase [Methanomicrobia archaeon]